MPKHKTMNLDKRTICLPIYVILNEGEVIQVSGVIEPSVVLLGYRISRVYSKLNGTTRMRILVAKHSNCRMLSANISVECALSPCQ